MAYAFVQQVDNGLASVAASAAVTITTTIHNAVIVISAQHPASVATITDTLGETWISLPGGGIFADGLFAYVCQNSLGGSNTITTHTNGSDLIGVVAYEYSGLATSGGVTSSVVLGQNGPGLGTDAVTSGNAGVSVLPSLIFGFSNDYNSGHIAAAGTGFTGRTSIWSGNPGGVHALAEDKRVTSAGSQAGTFTSANFSDIYVNYMIALPEIGAVGPAITAWWKA